MVEPLGRHRAPAPAVGVRRRGGHAGDERGSVLVEFALVIPIFAFMLFGMIQFGLAFTGWASLRNSVQSAARMAAIGDAGTFVGQLANPCPALAAAETYSGLSPASDQSADMYCEIVAQIGTPVGTSVGGTTYPEVDLQIQPGQGTQPGIVTVCAQVQAQPLTGLLPQMTLSSSSQFLVESAPNLEPFLPYPNVPNC
jgi:hypothetical protein